MTLRIAAHFLIFGNVWLRKIGATAHEQQFEDVMITGAPIKLRRGARAFSKIVKLLWLGRFEITAPGGAGPRKEIGRAHGRTPGTSKTRNAASGLKKKK